MAAGQPEEMYRSNEPMAEEKQRRKTPTAEETPGRNKPTQAFFPSPPSPPLFCRPDSSMLAATPSPPEAHPSVSALWSAVEGTVEAMMGGSTAAASPLPFPPEQHQPRGVRLWLRHSDRPPGGIISGRGCRIVGGGGGGGEAGIAGAGASDGEDKGEGKTDGRDIPQRRERTGRDVCCA